MYQHRNSAGGVIDLPANKVVCVGKNYQDHIDEMNKHFRSSDSAEPLLFMKPLNSLCALEQTVKIPDDKGACHNEVEVAILLQRRLCRCDDAKEAEQAIWGLGVALDLTLRDIQLKLKKAGHPWERSKSFDGSCPISSFAPKSQFQCLNNIDFSLEVNESIRQKGNTKDMLVGIVELLMKMSHAFTLDVGDIILTGTPSGVGPLLKGDTLRVKMAHHFDIQTQVIC
ncbi:fumarylacetoacetate hydrolase family protein [Alteromonas sp. ASW11-130]|uniref:fumarylacetoacetate hydrolase family protein n=1 Tax=Alteromonas sp. ASW11-130 TaxID=3015775 RepID=UPI0022419EC5|nr:fumarylacetoacetate hydrolase family protein [Alteromonas sp. ASW11-130]MCW8092550.1 fumarylacetoacetate hydrolase family protein [Alteromonas sp. ASW11-130]